jgi:WD40 repeat protein
MASPFTSKRIAGLTDGMNPKGAPYKYEKIIQTHNRFVQDVRFAPSGDLFASVGSDAKVFLYDGKTGETKADLGEGFHKGTIVCLNRGFFLSLTEPT